MSQHTLDELFGQTEARMEERYRMERETIRVALALYYAIDGDVQEARRLSQDMRLLGKPIWEIDEQDVKYLRDQFFA